MPVILGLASSHDASACVFIDGALAAAISQERVTRRKNDGFRLPLEALEHALEVAGVSREAYRARSGIQLVLNTSFNVHEEPIVCFPENAVQALADDRIDCLALGPYWAERAS